MRFTSAFFALALALTASLAHAAPHNARSSLDWQGLYIGTLPCASCPGFYTELQLLGKRSYRISETAEDKGEFSTWVQRGRFSWQRNGNSIRMGQGSDQRLYLVQENALEQLAANGDRVTGELAPHYRLHKAERFSDAAGQILVLAASVQQDEKTKSAEFDGRENLAEPKAAGQRSLTAHYQLNCAAKTYTMSKLHYYSALNGQGQELKLPAQSNAETGEAAAIELTQGDSRMQQVFARYCPR